MQAVMESLFSAAYLIVVIGMGCYIVRGGRGNRERMLFGVMTLVLGCGDAFHLVPRVIALCTSGLEDYTAALGLGKLVTSITMTVFYVMLYHVWRERYRVAGKNALTAAVYALAIARIALCAFPQNAWLSADAPLSWGIYRNIPFAMLGALIIVLFFGETRGGRDRPFRYLWLAVTLSFAFYIPVVLWADVHPLIGMLMLPKTCMYVWVVWMGFSQMRGTARRAA